MISEDYNYLRIEKAINFISNNIKSQPTLDEVAFHVNLSPFHFQKLFTEWVGVSPKKFLQYLNTSYLKKTIHQTNNLIEAAEIAGLSSQSRVYDLFTGIEAVTPNEYKTGGKGLNIFYGYHQTPFGECFLATTERGICAMAFITNVSKENDLRVFKNKWHFASLNENSDKGQEIINSIFYDAFNPTQKFHLLVQGTNFQIKVWEALLKIPQGGLITYQSIAHQIKNPKAVRAVGTAVGENPIAYLIPCHRVIRKQGIIGEYRWGSDRKKILIGWEAAQMDKNQELILF